MQDGFQTQNKFTDRIQSKMAELALAHASGASLSDVYRIKRIG